jgi:predicted transglutaminase-like cysteine proteinase
MSIVTWACALRVAVILSSIGLFAGSGQCRTSGVSPSVPQEPSVEPFTDLTAMMTEGPLMEKWLAVEARILDERAILESCRSDRPHCSSHEALDFLNIVEAAQTRTGLARLGEINRAINLAIRPGDDLANYGVIDYWSSPLETLTKGSGDCEDYAIAKLVALREAGIAAGDVRLVIVRDSLRSEDHAVVAARDGERWLILDNRRLMMLPDTALATYRPMFAIDEEGIRKYAPGSVTESASADRHVRDDLTLTMVFSFGFGSH